MAHESWFYVVYGVGLFFLSLKKEFVKEAYNLRIAWMNYLFVLFIVPVFTLVRALIYGTTEVRAAENMVKGIGVVDILASAMSWGFVGVSLFFFLKSFVLTDDE
jgi:hypothetical protein